MISLKRSLKRNKGLKAYWCMPIIPALGKQGQEDHKFLASLGYIVR
jgi:hypothetical protein